MARYSQVPWSMMRGMRNITIHGYRDVDLGIVCDTHCHDLPPLLVQLREILDREQ